MTQESKNATIIVANQYSHIVTELPDDVVRNLKQAMSYRIQGCEFTQAYADGKWDGMIKLLEDGNSFMTGLLSIVRDSLIAYGYVINIKDKRIAPLQNFSVSFTPPSSFPYEERPYAKSTVSRCVQYTRGIMQIATGGGKTLIVTELIAALKVKPFIYFVMSIDLMEQAVDTLESFLGVEVGIIGDGKCILKDVTVCMVQTAIMCLHANDVKFDIKKHKIDSDCVWDEDEAFILNNADRIKKHIADCIGLYFDEVHHAAADTCKEVIFAASNAYYKFGGSATPVREDGKELIIQGLFGRKIVEISATYLTERGYLVPGHIFYTRVAAKVDGDIENYAKRYEAVVVDNVDFNNAVIDVVKFLSTNDILTLVLVHRVKHGKALQKLIPGSEFLSGREKRKKRSEVISSMRRSELKVLIATSLADEGLDIKPLQAVLMLSGGSSVTRIPQRIGRCIRKYQSKKYGVFVYFRHTVKNLFEQGIKVREIIEQEPCFKIHEVGKLGDLKSAMCDFINEQDIKQW